MARTSFAKQLARKCQPYLHITPSAVLVLLWNFLMYSYHTLWSRFTDEFATEVATATWYKYGFVIIPYSRKILREINFALCCCASKHTI